MKKYPQPLDTQGLAGFFLLKRYMKGTRKSVKIYSGAYPQPAPAYWDMILRIIQQAKCHVLFCEDEETGGQGARKFTQRSIRPNINYIIEMDRRGANDAVFYGCCNREFTDYICSFGFQEAMGSFSDISVIAPYLEVAAVNISAGYYQEHRLNEYVRLDQMEKNAERILEIVRTDTERFDYVGSNSLW